MNPSEVYWVDFPSGAGRAQSGKRPAIVLQGSKDSIKLSTVLMVPLSSRQDALRFPGTVYIDPDTENELRRPTIALVFQLTALDKRFILSRAGFVSEAALKSIRDALDNLTERPGSALLGDAESPAEGSEHAGVD